MKYVLLNIYIEGAYVTLKHRKSGKIKYIDIDGLCSRLFTELHKVVPVNDKNAEITKFKEMQKGNIQNKYKKYEVVDIDWDIIYHDVECEDMTIEEAIFAMTAEQFNNQFGSAAQR